MPVTTLPPPPPQLTLGILTILGGFAGLFGTLIVRRIQSTLGWHSFGHWQRGILAFLSVFLIVVFAGNLARPLSAVLWSWAITPIAIRSDDGGLAFGHWWVDREGAGHSVILVAGARCRSTYDGRNADTFVEKHYACDGIAADLRLRRFCPDGACFRGRGILRYARTGERPHFAWFVFGPEARLAVLSRGLFGLPDTPPDAARFASLAKEGRTGTDHPAAPSG